MIQSVVLSHFQSLLTLWETAIFPFVMTCFKNSFSIKKKKKKSFVHNGRARENHFTQLRFLLKLNGKAF